MDKLKEQIEEVVGRYEIPQFKGTLDALDKLGKDIKMTNIDKKIEEILDSETESIRDYHVKQILALLTPQVGEIGKMLAYGDMATTDNRRRSFPPPESDEWLSYHDKEVNRKLDTIVTLLTPQVDGVSRDALYIGAEIRWAGMTPLERAEAIELEEKDGKEIEISNESYNNYLKDSREIVLDVSRMAINNVTALIEKWELFVTVTGELPDVLIFNQHQMDWYLNTMIKFARQCGGELTPFGRKNPTFRRIPIRLE